MAQRRLLLLLGILVIARWTTGSIRCYTCVSTANELTCLKDPENVPNGSPVTNCDKGPKECCTIVRQEYLEDKGKVISFSRGCQENCPDKMETIKTEDSSYRFYQTYCNTARCNIGPGNVSLDANGGGGAGGGDFIGPVAGQEDGASTATISLGLMVAGLLTVLLRP